jgi:hypothetical protein
VRSIGTKDAIARQEAESWSSHPKISQGNFFHNGRDVLPEVTQWHQLLRNSLRKTDKITGLVLDLIDKRMLLGDSEDRILSRDLCTELDKIAHKSQESPPLEIPSNIRTALAECKERLVSSEAYEADHESNSGLHTGPHSNRADQNLNITNHRLEYIKSALYPTTKENNFPNTDKVAGRPSVDTGILRPLFPINRLRTMPPRLDIPDKPNQEALNPSKTPPRPRLAKKRLPDNPQNVWQARRIMKYNRKTNIFNNKLPPDQTLARWYKDRDIVCPDMQSFCRLTDYLTEISC